ncbi:unnamed protein product [Hyaloperonospora brassicae]|uniref:BZIP domain-containing protein n=1 Tax=Hyaloperonospora brassicae TaxID=162125 RepID=A0AAV0SWQ4_HYABA|nr:unnamed protein product [Hyaloperonospora brassicae]
MNIHDRRMDITALCCSSTDKCVPLEAFATDDVSSPHHVDVAWPRDSALNRQRLLAVVPTTPTAYVGTGKASPSRKRSRRLSNSERGKLYRSRRKTYVQTLEEQVEELKQEVTQLDLCEWSRQQQLAAWPPARQPMGTTFANIVDEYFSLFKYGVPVTEQDGVVGIRQDQLSLSFQQDRYLKGLMHSDVVFGDSYGVHELLDQWKKYSLNHAGLRYEVKSLQLVVAHPSPVVLAPATLHVRFTRRTIEKIFPHVLWNEGLVQRLIGTEFAYSVGNTFYFGDDNKIHRYDTYVDFVAAFVDVLGNIEDSMTMMESALIRKGSMIGGDLLDEPQSFAAEKAQRVEMMGGREGQESTCACDCIGLSS